MVTSFLFFFYFPEIFPYFLGAASCEETKLYYLYYLFFVCVLCIEEKKTKNGQIKKTSFSFPLSYFIFFS